MERRKAAFVFDLDGTLNHNRSLPNGLPIRGRTTDSVIDYRVIELLLELAELTDLYVATGRSLTTTADVRAHFAAAGLRIDGWILEHGTRIDGCPAWNERVLSEVNLASAHAQIKEIVRQHNLSIDTEYYQGSHQSVLLYAVKEQQFAAAFLAELPDIIGKQFRIIAGRRKIALIPKLGDKYAAFQTAFGQTHYIRCAAGDTDDDLTLLRNAVFPVTLQSASQLVIELVQQRGGFVAASAGHEGTAAMLKAALAQFKQT